MVCQMTKQHQSTPLTTTATLLLSNQSVWTQIISDNLAMDQFLPPAQKSALNASKHWMAQEWPRYFGLRPLTRDRFLAPAVFLSGSNNNTSNPVHRREKHGRPLRHAVPCCAVHA